MAFFTDTAAQAAIDQEIATHRAAIYRLKLRRNSLSAVYNLPSDILSLIFIEYKQQTIFDEELGSWTPVLRVCSRWRQILLDTPQFWATITLQDCFFIYPMLERSRQAPLNLYYTLFKPINTIDERTYEEYLFSVMQCFQAGDRVDKLCFSFGPNHEDFVGELLGYLDEYNTDTTSIRTLKLEYPSEEAIDRTITFEQHLPWSKLQHLRFLELKDVLIPANQSIPIIPSLTRLVVTCEATFNGLSVLWVTQFLRKTPNIEIVELDEIIHNNERFSRSDVRISPVFLPKLKTLRLSAEKLDASRLLGVLQIPNDARVSATFSGIWHQTDSSAFLPSVKTLCSHLSSSRAPQRVVMAFNDRSKLFELKLFAMENDTHPFLDLAVPVFISERNMYYGWCTSAFSFSSVVQLTIDDYILTDNDLLSLSNILLACPNLQRLSLGSFDDSEASSLLTMMNRNYASDTGRSGIIAPELQVLSVTSLSCSPTGGGILRRLQPDNPTKLASLFLKFLQERRAMNVPVLELYTKGWNFAPEDISRLQEYVVVEVEGYPTWDNTEVDDSIDLGNNLFHGVQ
ncbi:hypothetical protein ONZ45_g6621 [Pleurotus djamor]|nr:hypothetical protein ONZ45_g6621 [Pleurotus djamor]